MAQKGAGGKRPGSGRKRGVPDAKTVEKRSIAEAVNQRIMSIADKIFLAQSQLALGSMITIRVDEEKDENGKVKRVHTRVTDADEIIAVLNYSDGLPCTVDSSYYYFTSVPPDHRALDSKLNRGLGKPMKTVAAADTSKVTEIAGKVVRRLMERGISEDVAQAEVAKLYPELSNAVH